MVEAQKSLKEKQFSRSILLLLLSNGTTTSFGLRRSVCINCIVFCHTIMPGFFNYCGTSSISQLRLSSQAALCSALKTQPAGADRQADTSQFINKSKSEMSFLKNDTGLHECCWPKKFLFHFVYDTLCLSYAKFPVHSCYFLFILSYSC